MTETFEIAIVVPEAEAPGLEADVRKAKGQVVTAAEPYAVPANQLDLVGDQQFEPLTVLVVVVSAAFLADRINVLLRRHKGEGGVVIDARERAATPIVIHTEALEPGEIVVIGKDGAQVFREDGVERAIGALAGLIGG